MNFIKNLFKKKPTYQIRAIVDKFTGKIESYWIYENQGLDFWLIIDDSYSKTKEEAERKLQMLINHKSFTDIIIKEA